MTGRRRSFRSRLALAGVAATGLFTAHWLSYLLAFPVATARAHVLEHTGHSYWDLAVKLAVAALVAALAGVFVGHLRGSSAHGDRAERVSFVAWRLIGIQVAGFAAMEVAERLLAGAPVSGLLVQQVFLVGLALQVLSAAVGAALLVWFDRAVRGVVARLREVPGLAVRRSGLRALLPVAVLVRPTTILAGGGGLRGPPRP